MNFNALGAVLKGAFAKVLVSRPDREARASIAKLDQVASERMARGASGFEETLRRVVGEMSK